ncbi:MAG: hypothetical protein IJA23_00110 [Clostridia bacterium]|nr:hypothetical protein [Clostridia bacterium]
MMKKKKNDKKYVIVSQKLYPSQINELSICCFVVKSQNLDDILSFIVNNGGRVVSAVLCSGVSRNILINSISGYSNDSYFVVAICQKEITDIFMLNICREFDFNKKGRGKAFVLDVLGYMGAKGPFVE